MTNRHDPFKPAETATTAVLEPPVQPVARRYSPPARGAHAPPHVVSDAPVADTPIPAAAPAKGVKKLNFGAAPVKKESKTAYPVFTDANGEAALIAERIKQRTAQLEALDGALKTDKAELRLMVSPFYFTVNQGRHEVPSSISVPSPAGEVLVTFQNRYSGLEDDASVMAILGDRTETFFRQAFEIKISGDKLPADAAQSIFDELQQLLARHNATEALEVKQSIKPTKDFHAARHLQLTPDENMALEQACPIVAMIKTKGRGE